MQGLRRACTALGIAVICLAPAGASAQQFVPTGRDTLRGLAGVEVLVEPLQPELARGGMSERTLALQVSEQLQAGGITIYTSQRDNPGVSKPYLYLHVNAASTGRDADVAVALQVHLRQTVQSLSSESRIVNAMTWDAHDVVVMPLSQAAVAIPRALRELIAVFIDDWRAVH